MKRVTLALLMAVVMLIPVTARAATSLDALLQQAKLAGTKVEGGYRVYIEMSGEATPLLLEEEQIGTSVHKMVNIYALVLEPPKSFVPPASMLKKLVELNGLLPGASVSLEGNAVVYKTSLLLSTATPDELNVRMMLAHVFRQELKKELQKFVDE